LIRYRFWVITTNVPSDVGDLVSVVEAFYSLNLPVENWLRIVAEKVRPLIDRDGLGVVGGLYSCPDPCSFTPTHALFCEVPEALQAVFFEASRSFNPVYVADSFLTSTFCLGADMRGWDTISTNRDGSARAAGMADALHLNAVEPDGEGCCFSSPQSKRALLSDDLHLTLTRIGRHLAAAHRLRRKHLEDAPRPDAAEAVLDPLGRVHHAVGAAQPREKQAALGRAARSMEDARRRSTGTDPRTAIADWKSVIAKRWSLVERFESDGKRFLLAMDNRPKPPSLELLSGRERDVVLRAARGHENKVIAHELGLAQSTVRVLIARAAAKVGARSRRDLLAKLGGLAVDPTGTR
jgi:DNA-binding CsgD family transcriptional regulator